MRRLGSGIVALALAAMAAAAPAYAADLPAPAAGYYPPPVYRPAVYDWTGIYFGGHIGLGLLEDQVNTLTTTLPLNANTRTNLSPYALVGGPHAGVNVEFAPWVVGAEVSATASAISGSISLPAAEAGVSENSTSAASWLFSATGRIGYAANTYLLYLKGGAAWAKVSYNQQILTTGLVASSSTQGTTRTGFVGGAGLEYGMTENLSAIFEYNFYDFGTRNFNFNATDPATGTAFILPVSIKSDIHTFTVGLNYRFNWSGGGPLAAAY